MAEFRCNIVTQGSGDWRCTTCGISGDKDEEPGQFCKNKPEFEVAKSEGPTPTQSAHHDWDANS